MLLDGSVRRTQKARLRILPEPTTGEGWPAYVHWVQALIRSRHLRSVTELGRRARVSRSALYDQLAGKTRPDWQTCARLAAFAGVPREQVEALAGRTGEEPRVEMSDVLGKLRDLLLIELRLPETVVNYILHVVESEWARLSRTG